MLKDGLSERCQSEKETLKAELVDKAAKDQKELAGSLNEQLNEQLKELTQDLNSAHFEATAELKKTLANDCEADKDNYEQTVTQNFNKQKTIINTSRRIKCQKEKKEQLSELNE